MNSTYHDTRGIEAYKKLSDRFQGALLGFLGYRAGKNYYDIGAGLEESISRGVGTIARWFVWLIGIKLWLLWTGITGWLVYLKVHDIDGDSFKDFTGDLMPIMLTGVCGIPITFVLSIAVTYNRYVDYSLFKRRLAYKLVAPLARRLNRVPTLLLNLVPIICWFAFNILFGVLGFDKPYDDTVYRPQPKEEAVTMNIATREDICPAIEAGATDADLAPLELYWPDFDLQAWKAEHCN